MEQGKKEGLAEGFTIGWQEGCKLGEEVYLCIIYCLFIMVLTKSLGWFL